MKNFVLGKGELKVKLQRNKYSDLYTLCLVSTDKENTFERSQKIPVKEAREIPFYDLFFH